MKGRLPLNKSLRTQRLPSLDDQNFFHDLLSIDRGTTDDREERE